MVTTIDIGVITAVAIAIIVTIIAVIVHVTYMLIECIVSASTAITAMTIAFVGIIIRLRIVNSHTANATIDTDNITHTHSQNMHIANGLIEHL